MQTISHPESTLSKKLIILLAVAGVSLSAIFVRYSNAPSTVLVFYRVLFASFFLLPVVLLKHRKELFSLKLKSLLLCSVSGIFLGLHFAAYFEAIQFTSIASCVVLVDTEVFFVAIAMFLLFKEKIPTKGILGILITFIGSVIVAMGDSGEGSNVLYGDFLAIAGAGFMAVYTMIGKTCRAYMSTTVYTFIVYLTAGITVALITLFQGNALFGYDSVNYLSALGMAVFCTLLGHSVFSWGLKYISASFISTAKLLEPVFASILGLLIFAQQPKFTAILGGVVILFGIYTYTTVKEKQI